MSEGDATAPALVQDEPQMVQLPGRKVKVTTGARLGRKWYEVERLLLSGESKLKIARMLKISAHSVRAVARQMDVGGMQPLAEPAAEHAIPSRAGLPDTLREKAMQAVSAISAEKLEKASPQSCAIVADRLLNRAESMEQHGHNMDFLASTLATFGVQPSHSTSRLTVEQKITVETQHKSQTNT